MIKVPALDCCCCHLSFRHDEDIYVVNAHTYCKQCVLDEYIYEAAPQTPPPPSTPPGGGNLPTVPLEIAEAVKDLVETKVRLAKIQILKEALELSTFDQMCLLQELEYEGA